MTLEEVLDVNNILENKIITNIYGSPSSGKTIMADGLKKQAQLMDRRPIIFDEFFVEDNPIEIFLKQIENKTDIIFVTTKKFESKHVNYYVETSVA